MSFNYIDIGIAVLVFISAIIGFARGFVREAISLATWVGAIILALMFAQQLADHLPIEIDNKTVKAIVAGVVIFTLVLIVGSLINFFLSRIISFIGLDAIDRILGGAFGVVRGMLIIALVVLLLTLGFTSITEMDIWKSSQFIPKFEEAAQWIQGIVPPDISKQVEEFLQRFGFDANNGSGSAAVQDTTATKAAGSE